MQRVCSRPFDRTTHTIRIRRRCRRRRMFRGRRTQSSCSPSLALLQLKGDVCGFALLNPCGRAPAGRRSPAQRRGRGAQIAPCVSFRLPSLAARCDVIANRGVTSVDRSIEIVVGVVGQRYVASAEPGAL